VRCRHAKRNTTVSPDGRIEVRIGINVDESIVEDGDIFGDV
jgi:class 3 adenylate cyclase